MAWNLINEPRCFQCPDALQSWIENQAAYVKSLDGNHLLTIGEEGFYGIADTARSNFANPQGAATYLPPPPLLAPPSVIFSRCSGSF